MIDRLFPLDPAWAGPSTCGKPAKWNAVDAYVDLSVFAPERPCLVVVLPAEPTDG